MQPALAQRSNNGFQIFGGISLNGVLHIWNLESIEVNNKSIKKGPTPASEHLKAFY